MAMHGGGRRLDQEEEIIPAIRHDDAEWKIIQQNTFTRWVNNHLQKCGESIQNLETDFSDGLKLIHLAAALSQKNVGKFNKKVSFRSQKLENVSLALNFFQNEENIKIINIDSTHIVDHNKKLILGLIWTLILHYSISMGWIQERNDGQPEETPKQKLLNWIRSRLPGVPLSNFTSDWNDGVALGALVNALTPGSLPDWDQWSPNEALPNTQKAMQTAQDLLQVAPLIAPAELIHPDIDEMSVMTYLSQFPAARPVVIKTKVSAEYRNLDEHPLVGKPTEFQVKLSPEGYKPKLTLRDNEGNEVHSAMTKLNDDFFNVKYTPSRVGPLNVDVSAVESKTFTAQSIPDASRTIHVQPLARLLDYPKRAHVGDELRFDVVDANEGVVEAVVVDATGVDHRLPVLESNSPGNYNFLYTVPNAGLHSLNVFHRKNHIAGSPFPLRVKEKNDFEVWGRGICANGVRVGDKVPVHVQSNDPEENVANANLQIHVVQPDGTTLPVSAGFDEEDGKLTFEYSPHAVGEHAVTVTAAGELVKEHKVDVSPATKSKIRAFGPGLCGGIVNEPSVFHVETNGEADSLAFSIEGPSKADIECSDRGNGAALVSYTPKHDGIYKVNVLAGGDHIQDSPFVLRVHEADDAFKPSAARVTGIEENKPYPVGEKIPFRVDTRLVGADVYPKVAIYDKNLHPLAYDSREITPGIFEYAFQPKEDGKYIADVSLRGVAAPGAPFLLNVSEPVDLSKLKIYGPGVEGPVYSQEPTHFTIDAKQAGPGAVEVALADRFGEAVDIDVLDNRDGSFTVKYTAPKPGAYQLNVIFAGDEISPIEINVKPRVDVSGIRVEGLENGKVLAGSRLKPKVDLCGLEPEGKGLELTDEVNGKLYSVKLNEKPPGVFSTNIPLAQIDPKDGRTRHDFKLHFDDVLVKEAKIDVVDGTDVNKCDVQGDGLKEGVVGEISSFHVDLDGAGSGELNVEIKGPSKADPVVRDNGNGTCFVDYCPTLPGNYEVGVLFGDKEKQHVKGSPYHVTVDHPKNIDAVKVDGLDNAKCRVGEPISFKVDASHTKLAPVTARTLPIYQQPIIEQDPKNPRVFYGKFVPIGDAGVNVPIEVLCDGEPVPGSPFPVRLLPETEPENVKFGSYGSDVVQHPVASNDAVVEVDTRDCGVVKDVRAEVVGPDGKPRKTSLTPSKTPGVIDLTWPTDVSGEYSATVYINGKKVPQTIFVNATVVGTKSDVVPASQLACREVVLDEPIHVSYVHPGREKANFSIVAQRPDAVKCDIRRSRDPKSGDVKEELLIHPTKEGPNVLEVYYGGNHVDTIEYDTLSKSQYDELVNKKARADDVEQYEKRYEQPVLGEAVVPNGSSPLRNGSSSSHSSSSGDVDPKALFPREFKFNLSEDSNIRVSQLEAIVMPPSKKQEAAEIIDNHDGTILVKYSPKVFGSHELSILQNGAQLQGTPIKFFVDSYGDGYATVYGPGLQNAVVGEPAAFTVCAKGSHAKEVSVSIEGPAQSAIKIHDNKDGTCAVTWVPPVPGEYKVHVLLGGKDVHDSPFTVLVMGEGQKRAHLSVGSTSEVALNIAQGELKGISASIKSPSGIEEPCFVRLIDGGRLGVSFTPREVGEHLITVKRDGKLVPKAPFKIKVDKNQVGDASKVEVSGPGKSKAISLQPNEILIDTTKAGYGGLSISVQGPSKAELTCKEVKAGLIKVIYTPTEPGVYAIAIKFADHHVRDSPLTVNCSGKGAGRVVANVSRRVEQTSMSLPGQESLMFLKLPNTSPMDINARIMDPKGHNEFIEMRDLGDQYYQIRFTPSMEGVHTLSVMHKDAHVNGSPFQFTVGSFNEGGAHKVRAAGQGVVRGETGHKNTFNVYSREAGPGNLSVTVEGPSKANIEFHEHKDGNCHVEYKVAQPGEYIVAVKFNDGHIPDSPFKVFIAPATGEVRKLELASFHDQGIPVGKAFTFTVLTHRAKGHLEGKLVAPNNEIETIDIVPIEDGESYALRFVPKETGNHYIHVTLDGAPMRDSPFRLRVGGTDVSDPTAVSASGEGLVKGATGQKCEFIISTVNAGAGILQVQMDGPSKVTLDAYELEKGYKVRYTPLAPGEYFSSIKYNGVHIPGSPFKIPVEGKVLGGNGYNETSFVKIDALSKTLTGTVAVAPEYHGDASKVTAKGAGLNKFFPGRPAAFQIDTGLAGQDLLMVGVVTARGPCEEVVVRHQGNGQYVCTYRVPDRVKGFVFIRYGDQQIPGSPFAIHP